MVKEYLFKVTKEQFIKVSSDNKEDAYEIAEEKSILDDDESILDIELVDVYDHDEDAEYDDYFGGIYE